MPGRGVVVGDVLSTLRDAGGRFPRGASGACPPAPGRWEKSELIGAIGVSAAAVPSEGVDESSPEKLICVESEEMKLSDSKEWMRVGSRPMLAGVVMRSKELSFVEARVSLPALSPSTGERPRAATRDVISEMRS